MNAFSCVQALQAAVSKREKARPTAFSKEYSHIHYAMKKLIALFFALVCAASAAPYSKNIIHVLQQLRTNVAPSFESNQELPLIDGCAVGDAARPGTFYLLYPYVENRASVEDLTAMLGDVSPAVRLMAAKVILHSKRSEIDAKIADRLLNDKSHVVLAAFGCAFSNTTVGAVVKQLKDDHNFLGDIPANGIVSPAPSKSNH